MATGPDKSLKVAMADSNAFPLVFAELKQLLVPYAARLVVTGDSGTDYTLDAPASTAYPKGLFFASVRLGKRYVSYHLMPVYLFPDLLGGLSDPMRKRMQGKSCFNFTRLDATWVKELSELTAAGFARYRQAEIV